MQQPTVTLILGIAGILGTLGGITLGQWMSQTRAQREWGRDKRIEELRELLVALLASMDAELKTQTGVMLDMETEGARVVASYHAIQVMQSRMFTAPLIIRLRMEERWAGAVQEHQRTLDTEKLAKTFHQLRFAIVEEGSKFATHVSMWRKLRRKYLKS